MADKPAAGPCVCRVCGDSAHYSYYGAVVCYSCKVFFRRNARDAAKLHCRDGKSCEINIQTRRLCSYCRMAKCFANGMHADLLRASRSAPIRQRERQHTTTRGTSTALVASNQAREAPLITTLNLLRADQSTLSIDQWNHISNLVHCFDNYSGLPFIQQFINDQSALPPKFRYRLPSVNNFFSGMLCNVQLVFERNRDYLTLSISDRTTLLQHTVEYTTGIGAAVVLRQAQLYDRPTFLESAKLIFQPAAVTLVRRLIDQLDPDLALMKMICAIVAFLVSNYTVYQSTSFSELSDLKAIVRIQDMYTELVWRYLVYKHNHHDAVLCFANLIRCLFLVNDSVVEAHDAQHYADLMETVIETTEQKLTSGT